MVHSRVWLGDGGHHVLQPTCRCGCPVRNWRGYVSLPFCRPVLCSATRLNEAGLDLRALEAALDRAPIEISCTSGLGVTSTALAAAGTL